MLEVIENRPSDGTRRTPDSVEQAAFQADRNASVSSVEPSPTAPKDLTLKTQGSGSGSGSVSGGGETGAETGG